MAKLFLKPKEISHSLTLRVVADPPVTQVGSKYGTQYVFVNSIGSQTSHRIPVLTDGLKTGVTAPGIASISNVRVLTDGLKLRVIVPA